MAGTAEILDEFDRVISPLAGVMQLSWDSLSPEELASCYTQIVRADETARDAAVRIEKCLAGAAIGAAESVGRRIVALGESVIDGQRRVPPSSLKESAGVVLTGDFKLRAVHDNGQSGLVLGSVDALPPAHWLRGLFNDDDLIRGDGDLAGHHLIYIGDGRLIDIRHARNVTRKIRDKQRAVENEYKLQQQQVADRDRLEWEQSTPGQLAAMRKLCEDQGRQIQELQRDRVPASV